MSTPYTNDSKTTTQEHANSHEELLQLLKSEKANFLQIAEQFYELQRRTDEHYLQFCRNMIESIDRVLNAGDWDSSLFLRNTIRPIRELRERAAQVVERVTGEQVAAVMEREIDQDAELVYVSLFQVNGNDMRRWEMQLRALPRYMTGRPIYKHEHDVQSAIRAKINNQNDAYVVLAVPPMALQQQIHVRTDKHGHELVAMKQGQLQLQHIIEFVHAGKRYTFNNGKLVEKS